MIYLSDSFVDINFLKHQSYHTLTFVHYSANIAAHLYKHSSKKTC